MTRKMRTPRGEIDDEVFLEHILIAIEEIEGFVEDASGLEDKKTGWAVERGLEIIGEASRNLSKAFTDKHTDIPWKDIIGMRHKVSHDYFGINPIAIKNVLKYDLPTLKPQITALLQQFKTDGTS